MIKLSEDEYNNVIVKKAERAMRELVKDHTIYSGYYITALYTETIVPQVVMDYVIEKYNITDKRPLHIFVPVILIHIYAKYIEVNSEEKESMENGYVFNVDII